MHLGYSHSTLANSFDDETLVKVTEPRPAYFLLDTPGTRVPPPFPETVIERLIVVEFPGNVFELLRELSRGPLDVSVVPL